MWARNLQIPPSCPLLRHLTLLVGKTLHASGASASVSTALSNEVWHGNCRSWHCRIAIRLQNACYGTLQSWFCRLRLLISIFAASPLSAAVLFGSCDAQLTSAFVAAPCSEVWLPQVCANRLCIHCWQFSPLPEADSLGALAANLSACMVQQVRANKPRSSNSP